MTRREFPRAVKVAVIKRSTRDGVVYCEGCGLPVKKWRIDHTIADSHGGPPTIDNAKLLGKCCYAEKDARDTTIAAKLKRVESRHIGATTPQGRIANRGFPQREKTPRIDKSALPPLPRRNPLTKEIIG